MPGELKHVDLNKGELVASIAKSIIELMALMERTIEASTHATCPRCLKQMWYILGAMDTAQSGLRYALGNLLGASEAQTITYKSNLN